MEEFEYVEVFPDGEQKPLSGKELGTPTMQKVDNLIRGGKMTRKSNKVAPAQPAHDRRRISTGGRKGAVAPSNGRSGVNPVNSLQTFVKSTPARVTRSSRHGETAEGTIFLGPLHTATKQAPSLDDLALQLVVPLNPANLGDSFLGNSARFFERFRFRRIRIHYLTASSTTSAGTIVVSHQADPLNEVPIRSYLGSNLYTTLFSRENTMMGPIWENSYMDVPVTKQGWFYTDAKYGHTMEDLFQGYVLAYSTASSGTPGRLAMEFIVDFDSRANNIGNSVPRPMSAEATASIPATTAGAAIVVTSFVGITSGNDKIYAFIVDGGSSNFATSGGGAGFNDFMTTSTGFDYREAAGAPLFTRQNSAGDWNLFLTIESAVQRSGTMLSKHTTTGNTYLVGHVFEVQSDNPEIV